MSQDKPKITMLLEDWDFKRDQIQKLEAEIASHKNSQNQQILNSNEMIPGLIETIRAAIPVIQFACGNLPTNLRNWPGQTLKRFAELLKTLPTITAHEQELCRELLNIADDVRKHEDARDRAKASLDLERLKKEQETLISGYEAHMAELKKVMEEHKTILTMPASAPDSQNGPQALPE